MLRLSRTILAALLLSLAPALAWAQAGFSRDAEQLVGLLDYVAGDYSGAVSDGRILNADEYREQQAFVARALELASTLSFRDAGLIELQQIVARRGSADEVVRLARATRDRAIRELGVAVLPAKPASRERASLLYGQLCASCHGVDGMANTEEAKKLNPKPRAFGDPDFLSTASPRRAYHALTFGIAETGMASFDVLPPEDRLALAFFVFGFVHEGRVAEKASVSLREAALRTDAELLPQTGASGLAWLRTRAPWMELDPIEEARQLAHAAMNAPSTEEARRLALDAYLQGFESAEARLHARNPALIRQVEKAFFDFRLALEGGDRQAANAKLRVLDERLDHAAATLSENAPRGTYAFLMSFVIFAREGFEVALIIAALLAVLRRLERPGSARAVHVGWIAALVAGGVTWWLSSVALAGLAAQREAIEGVVSLLAATVLFYVSFWLLSRADTRRWVQYLRARVEEGVKRGSMLGLFGISFLAAYREAFETVLFYRALLGEGAADRPAIAAGVVVGAVSVVFLAWLVFRAGTKLPLASFFGASGVLMCLLAVIFVGSGLHDLRVAGWMSARPAAVPESSWLGLYGDWLGLSVQGGMLLALLLAGATLLVRRSRDDRMSRWSDSASGRGSSPVSPS